MCSASLWHWSNTELSLCCANLINRKVQADSRGTKHSSSSKSASQTLQFASLLMLPLATQGHTADCYCLFSDSGIVHYLSFCYTDEKNQKGCSTQDKGVKVVDTPQQRDGKSDSASDQHQPPTETMVSLTTVCVVSAVTQTLYWSHLHTHTSVHLTFPLCLSHPLTCCLCSYQFFTARYT